MVLAAAMTSGSLLSGMNSGTASFGGAPSSIPLSLVSIVLGCCACGGAWRRILSGEHEYRARDEESGQKFHRSHQRK